jgi:hypothetical protein
MSRSPRKLLKRALDPLDELAALLERYPEAKADLVGQLGTDGVDEILHVRKVVASSVERLTTPDAPGDGRHSL